MQLDNFKHPHLTTDVGEGTSIGSSFAPFGLHLPSIRPPKLLGYCPPAICSGPEAKKVELIWLGSSKSMHPSKQRHDASDCSGKMSTCHKCVSIYVRLVTKSVRLFVQIKNNTGTNPKIPGIIICHQIFGIKYVLIK